MVRLVVRALPPKLLIPQVDGVPLAVVAAEVLAGGAGIVASAAPPAAGTDGPLWEDEGPDVGLEPSHLEGGWW